MNNKGFGSLSTVFIIPPELRLRQRRGYMSDKELIDLIAETWLENGGDSEGFTWVVDKIKEAIQEKEEDDVYN
jgi:hypothetical protein